MLVVNVEVADVDVPTVVLSDVPAALSCHLVTWSGKSRCGDDVFWAKRRRG